MEIPIGESYKNVQEKSSAFEYIENRIIDKSPAKKDEKNKKSTILYTLTLFSFMRWHAIYDLYQSICAYAFVFGAHQQSHNRLPFHLRLQINFNCINGITCEIRENIDWKYFISTSTNLFWPKFITFGVSRPFAVTQHGLRFTTRICTLFLLNVENLLKI